MGASRTKAREIPHARHDFPHYCRGIQLLMANPSSCAGLKRNSAENLVPYRTIPHGWAFRPSQSFTSKGLWSGRKPTMPRPIRARNVSTMFDEPRAMADRHVELHADRARLQAEL
jgi:hypothetical protein